MSLILPTSEPVGEPTKIIQPGAVDPQNVIVLTNHIWSQFNTTGKDVVLESYHRNPAKVKKITIPPKGRIVMPKQVQFLHALMKYDAVLYGGAVGAGKSHMLRWALIWLLVNWAKAEEFIGTWTSEDGLDLYVKRIGKELVLEEGGAGEIVKFASAEAALEAIAMVRGDVSGLQLEPKRTENSGLALRGVEVGLFCETYKALEDRQIGKLKQIDPAIGKYVDNGNPEFRLSARFGGGKIKLRNLDDYAKYASAEFGAIAVDELTYNPKNVWDFLRTRRRWPPIEHCPMFAATNPGQIGHQWVYKAFIDPVHREKPHYDEEEDYWNKGYHFIQALPKDNPLLTKQYRSDMNKWPEKLQRALKYGDWSVYAGQYFKLDPNIHWVPDFPIPETWNRIRVIDHGGAHPTVCLWMAADPEGNVYVYREYSLSDGYAEQHKRAIVQLSGKETYRVTVGDPAMWASEYSATNNRTPAEVYNDSNDGLGSLYMVKANNMRVQGWQAMQNAFGYELKSGKDLYDLDADGRPVLEFIRKPKLYIFRSCVHTWDSLSNVIHDDVRVEDVKKTKGYYAPGQGDDEADCVRYGYLQINPSAIPDQRRAESNERSNGLLSTLNRKLLSKFGRTSNARY